jgi:hypothetical protein
MRFFDLRTESSRCKHLERSTSPVLGCHYRVYPQRLVDDFLIERSLGRICGAKPPIGSNRSATFPVPEGTPEGVRTESSVSDGQARSTRSRMLEVMMEALFRTWAEASVRDDAKSQVTTQTQTSLQRASPEPGPKRGDGCFLDALRVTEVTDAAPKLPCWRLAASRENPRGFHRGEDER